MSKKIIFKDIFASAYCNLYLKLALLKCFLEESGDLVLLPLMEVESKPNVLSCQGTKSSLLAE